MPYKNGKIAWNEIVWTPGMIKYIRDNFSKLTNPQLAEGLGLKLTTVRTKCHELGLKRMEMEYWSKGMVTFLKKNYRKYGDTELAEMFCMRWFKEKGWKKGQIEKKRRYLKLKRTDAEKHKIYLRNKKLGMWAMCPVKAWITRGGSAMEGEIRWWKTEYGSEFPVIKKGDGFIHWNRYMWEKHNGKVPNGMNVVFKNDDHYDIRISNLELLTNRQLAIRNGKKHSGILSDEYIIWLLSRGNEALKKDLRNNPEMIDLKRTQLQLNRQINEQK